jgi:hypothetical protein
VPEAFRKRIQFSRLIKANGRLREFNFLKSLGPDRDSYEVDVCDESGKRFMFTMKTDGKDWKLKDQALPTWIKDAEPNLSAAIVEEDK